MLPFFRSHAPQRALLIFNPRSGGASAPDRLQAVVAALQAAGYRPEVYLVQPGTPMGAVVKDGLQRGQRLFVVCGGDGTIDSVAGALAGTRGTLGIVPAGTRNNVAFSLGLPDDPTAAVAVLRAGRRLKIDVGLAAAGTERRVFLEACSVGLLSALFPATDEIQHGNLAKVGDLLGALIASPVAEIRLVVDGQPALHTQAHVVVAANMLFVGPRFRVNPASALDDSRLDLVVYAELSKLDLLGSALQAATGGAEDPRIRHYCVQRAVVETQPPMPVVLDGFPFEASGPLRLSVWRRALNVIAGPSAPVQSTPQPAPADKPTAT